MTAQATQAGCPHGRQGIPTAGRVSPRQAECPHGRQGGAPGSQAEKDADVWEPQSWPEAGPDAQVVDRETEAQSKNVTHRDTWPWWQPWDGILVCSSVLFLPHLALGTNILVSADFDLNMFILSSQMPNPL